MAIIGTFKTQDGGYAGSVNTLTLAIKQAQFRATGADDGKSPDFRIFAGQAEIGAGWKKTSREAREYVSVKLDDPSFVASVYASLVQADEGWSLIWSRSRSAD
jgi:uncharacterized protein (DUF736 family)